MKTSEGCAYGTRPQFEEVPSIPMEKQIPFSLKSKNPEIKSEYAKKFQDNTSQSALKSVLSGVDKQVSDSLKK